MAANAGPCGSSDAFGRFGGGMEFFSSLFTNLVPLLALAKGARWLMAQATPPRSTRYMST
jgi:hypothetical protein